MTEMNRQFTKKTYGLVLSETIQVNVLCDCLEDQ